LQDEKKSIDEERAALDRLPKSWAALSTPAVPLKVLKRGDVLTPGDDAPPGALSAFGVRRLDAALDRGELPTVPGPQPLAEENQSGVKPPQSTGDIGITADDPEPVRRLKLADWIANPDNPLAWRVIVNRVWQHHFGAGIVTTPSDFGAGGARPSHPELLDWLADEFRSRGGRFKALHRMIVRSAVYRQAAVSGQASPDARASSGNAIDANNTLLWRPNRRRLDAETLRDSILATSGTLDRAMGGPSYRVFNYIEGNIPVYEPLPETPATWRRTVYRHVVRTHRQPFLDTFDCPDPSVMTPARSRTTTPLQALSLLNNPFIFEQSRQFADRIAREAGPDPAAQSRRAFRLALLREPTTTETEAAQGFVQRYGLDTLCRVLFNTNEFLYVE
jgi:hypothetical protein